MNYQLSFSYVWDYRQAILGGLATTAFYALISMGLGTLAGMIVAFGRQSGNRLLAGLATGYVEIFRGAPLLVLLFWTYYSLPILTGTKITGSVAAIISLSLFMSALAAECFRSAMQTIGQEQHDACRALGLPPLQSALLVILPQTLLLSIPTLLSSCIVVFKESALVSAVGITDLMYNGRAIAEATARPIEILTVVAVIYFVLAFIGTRVASALERYMLNRLAL